LVPEISTKDVVLRKEAITHYYVDVEGEPNLEEALYITSEEVATSNTRPFSEFLCLQQLEITRESKG